MPTFNVQMCVLFKEPQKFSRIFICNCQIQWTYIERRKIGLEIIFLKLLGKYTHANFFLLRKEPLPVINQDRCQKVRLNCKKALLITYACISLSTSKTPTRLQRNIINFLSFRFPFKFILEI